MSSLRHVTRPVARVFYRNSQTLARASVVPPEGLSMAQIQELAQNSPTPLTLQQMKSFACEGQKLRLMSGIFLHKELQIRIARAIVELFELPRAMVAMPSIQKVLNFYAEQLNTLHQIDLPDTPEKDMQFTETLARFREDGLNIVPLVCGGLKEFQSTDIGANTLRIASAQDDLNQKLDQFFLSRIGLRMLMGQHVESLTKLGGRVENLDVLSIVQAASDRASILCEKYLGVAPPVHIQMSKKAASSFMYVESHLHHMVFELVKNSMHATINHAKESANKTPRQVNMHNPVMNPNSRLLGFVLPRVEDVWGVTIYPDVRKYRRVGELPPVQIVISQGQEDLTIKVADDGGGVPRSRWRRLWHYDYTTSADFPPKNAYGYHDFLDHFSGGGYGLPITRLFARYFGGEVTFISLEGSGSSAFIQVPRLGNKTELVPGHANFTLQPLYF